MLHIKKTIYNHRLLSIILAALLTTAILTVLVNLTWLMGGTQKSITVMEQNGIYDLTDIKDLEKKVIKMVPGDTYYPNIYLMPDNVDIAIPENITRFEEIRAEYLSQRFVLKMPEYRGIYSLTFKLSGRHAIRVYVNGELMAQNGQLGTTKQDTEVWENNITFHGSVVNGEIDVLIHSAQF